MSEDDSETTVIRETTVIKETIPGKDLPDTGGAEGDASTAGLLLGTGAFVLLGALVARFVALRSR